MKGCFMLPSLAAMGYDVEAGCWLGVNRVVLTVGQPLPVYPDKRAISEAVVTSHLCTNGGRRRLGLSCEQYYL